MADPTESLSRIVQTKGDISITPIVISFKAEDSKESSPAPKPRVQFSDKVERFPESVPTSPNPVSPQQDEPKKFAHETHANGAPQIENVMSIQHNAPYSAGPHHDLVIEYEQLPKAENANGIKADSSSTQETEQPEALLTNVILNVEMVRTAKEHPPEDEDDETMARIAFSLPASNVQENTNQTDKTNQEQQLFKSPKNEDETDQKENKSEKNLLGAEKVADEIMENVVNELKEEKLQQIDLSPLLNKPLENPDIATINAEANRRSPSITEAETKKTDKEAKKSESKQNEKVVEIPIVFVEATMPFESATEIGKIHLGLPEFEDILGDYIPRDKFIDIAIIFDEQTPSTSSEQKTEEPKQLETKGEVTSESNVPTPKSAEPESKKVDQTFDIVVHVDSENGEMNEEQLVRDIHRGFEIIEELADEFVSNEKFVDIVIVFEDQESSPAQADNQNVPPPTSEKIPTESAATGASDAQKAPESQAKKDEKLIEIAVVVEPETGSFDDESVIKAIHKGLADAEELLEEFVSPEKFVQIAIVFEEEEEPPSKPKEEIPSLPDQKEKDTGESTSAKVSGNLQEGKVEAPKKTVDISIVIEPETLPFNQEIVIKEIHKGLPEAYELPGEFKSTDKLIEIPIINDGTDLSTASVNIKIVNIPIHVEKEPILSDDQEIVKKIHQGLPPAEELPEKFVSKDKFLDIKIIFANDESADELPEVLTPIPIIFEKDWTLPENQTSQPAAETAFPEFNENEVKPEVPSTDKAENIAQEQPNEYFDVKTIGEEEPSEYINIPVGYIVEPTPYIDIPVGYIEEPIYFEVPVGYIVEPLYFEIPVTYEGKLLEDDEAIKSVHKGVPLAKPLPESAPSGPVEKFVNIPIHFFPEEEIKEEEQLEKPQAAIASEEKKKDVDDVNYQSTFAKPLIEEDKSKEVPEKVEVKPEEVVFQSSFAKPMSQEPSPIKKEAPTALETQQQLPPSTVQEPTPIQKETPAPLETQQQPISLAQQESAKSPTANELAKPLQPSEPSTPEWQKSPQSSWLDSYDDGETIYDKPASAEVHNIPIVLPTGKVVQQQDVTKPAEPSTFVSADDNILYYEVPAEGEKQQEAQVSSLPNVAGDQKTSASQPAAANGAAKPDEVELNINEYEEQLKKNTKEALQLVDKLVESSQKIQQLEREKQEIERKKQQEEQRSRSRSSSQTRNVQFNENELMEAHSYKVNPDLLKDANSIALIPDFKIAIADFENGLTLFNLYTKEIKRVEGGSKWRRPQCLIYNPRAKEFFVLVEYSVNDDGKYEYYIMRFSKDLEYINRVEAPVFIKDKDVSVFRLCYCHRTGSLYLAASTYANGYLYELSAEEKWIEIYNCRNKIFADISVLAVVGPVTELIVLESTRSYANILSIYGTEATHVRSLAVCEKPGTLCIDETGHIIIHDKSTSKICLHSRISFLKTMEIALVDHANVRLSAWDGLLAVLCPNKKDLRIYKY